jgi:hypothetical protein
MLIYFARSANENASPGIILDAALSGLGRATRAQIARVHQALGDGRLQADPVCDKTNDQRCEPPPPWWDPRGWAAALDAIHWDCVWDVLEFWDGTDEPCGGGEEKKPKHWPYEPGSSNFGDDPGIGGGGSGGGSGGTGDGGGTGTGAVRCELQYVETEPGETRGIRTRQYEGGLVLDRTASGEIVIKWRPIVVPWLRGNRVTVPAPVARLVSVAGRFSPILLCFLATGDQPRPRGPNTCRCTFRYGWDAPPDCPPRVYAQHPVIGVCQELAKNTAPVGCRRFYGHCGYLPD